MHKQDTVIVSILPFDRLPIVLKDSEFRVV